MDRIWEAFIGRKQARLFSNGRTYDQLGKVIREIGITRYRLFIGQPYLCDGRKRTYSTFHR